MKPHRVAYSPGVSAAPTWSPVKILVLGLALAAVAFGCASPAPVPSADAASAAAVAPAITPVKDQRALAVLKQMSDTLAGAKSMSFETMSMTPIQGPNAQWIHVFSTAEVKMRRPNDLFIRTGGDAFAQRIYFDGHVFSAAASQAKLYTQLEMPGTPGTPGTIDAMLAQASEKAGYSFPFSDVLLSDPFASWSNGLEGAVYVGESQRGGEKLNHLALTAKDVDWEIWIGMRDHLPRMVYVKYMGTRRSPSVLIEFSKWRLGADIPASTFAFKPPAGAKKAVAKAPEGSSK